MRGVETDRSQHRHHFARKVGADPLSLCRGQVAASQEPDAFARQSRQDILVEKLVLGRNEIVRFLRDLREDLHRGHAVRADGERSSLDLRLEAGNANLEKLIEVARHDAQEPQALEQRGGATLRLRQHPAVERQLPEFTVDVQLRKVARPVHRPAPVLRLRAPVARTSACGRVLGVVTDRGYRLGVGGTYPAAVSAPPPKKCLSICCAR